MNATCPVCDKSVDHWLTKDGKVRSHSRPVPIPGGLSSAHCSGSGCIPVETMLPKHISQIVRLLGDKDFNDDRR